MGRPRTFDEDAILDRAMLLFWRKGYEATAMSDLVEELGLGRGSIYAAFGDKHGLFLRALTRYLDRQAVLLASALSDEGPALAQLREVLEQLLRADAACSGAGCFSVNSMAELLPHDREVAALARQSLQLAEELFTRQLERAADQGELSPAVSPQRGAALLMTLVQGLQIVRKARPEAEYAVSCLDTAFTLLAGADAAPRASEDAEALAAVVS